MARLVGISNRTAAGDPKAGGLAVALWDALVKTRGMWLGWSGETVDHVPRGSETYSDGGVDFVLTDLSHAEAEGYYFGYANSALWPVLHYRVDLASFDEGEFEIYADVNARFAKMAMSRIHPSDFVWVHDYHFFLLGRELRQQGWQGRTGYFLHVPFPPPEVFMSIPQHGRLMRALAEYDVIGVQTRIDRRNLEQYFFDHLGAERIDDDRLRVLGREITVKAYPIGIKTADFRALSTTPTAEEAAERLSAFLGNRSLILGVDRMDYSKGIPNRFEAVGSLLDHYPDLRGRISYTQVAPPSRSKVEEYRHLREQLDELSGRINGDYGDLDWIPIRYLARSYPREQLAGLYRIASVALVTPLQDGMNLVAKEFVAAQDEEDPGVLVLSQFAGAAEQISDGALLVNPHDRSGMADTIAQALSMSLDERKDRWRRMYDVVAEQDIDWWRDRYLSDLGVEQALVSP